MNGSDPILKERLFGLANEEGNHGEDGKGALVGDRRHADDSWMQWLYRYPQAEYPYERLRAENARRGRDEREYELSDTGILDQSRFVDVLITYAKAETDDLCIAIEVTNNGPEAAPLDGLLPILGPTEVPAWITGECPDVTTRLRWLQRRRPEIMGPLLSRSAADGRRMLLSLVDPERLRRIRERLFDPAEFLSPYPLPVS